MSTTTSLSQSFLTKGQTRIPTLNNPYISSLNVHLVSLFCNNPNLSSVEVNLASVYTTVGEKESAMEYSPSKWEKDDQQGRILHVRWEKTSL